MDRKRAGGSGKPRERIKLGELQAHQLHEFAWGAEHVHLLRALEQALSAIARRSDVPEDAVKRIAKAWPITYVVILRDMHKIDARKRASLLARVRKVLIRRDLER